MEFDGKKKKKERKNGVEVIEEGVKETRLLLSRRDSRSIRISPRIAIEDIENWSKKKIRARETRSFSFNVRGNK